MGKILENLNMVLLIGLVAAIGLMMGFHADALNAAVVLRWLHVFFGITWIGLLYYFNFVQIPTMPSIPAELKPGSDCSTISTSCRSRPCRRSRPS